MAASKVKSKPRVSRETYARYNKKRTTKTIGVVGPQPQIDSLHDRAKGLAASCDVGVGAVLLAALSIGLGSPVLVAALALARQATAPKASKLSAEEMAKRAPRPPHELVDALQDRIYPASGRLLASKPLKTPKAQG